jgi:uncharacterized protein (TIGR03086 family)
MSENLRSYTKALFGFDHVVKLTPERAWARKSPCAGWTGKDVYEHAVGGVKMVHSFATTGKGPKSPPKLGTDPLGQWEKLRDGTLAALDDAGALHSEVHEPFGPEFGSMPMDAFIGFMGADLVIHTWDLARTAKADERLDPGLCTMAFAAWKALPEAVLRGLRAKDNKQLGDER